MKYNVRDSVLLIFDLNLNSAHKIIMKKYDIYDLISDNIEDYIENVLVEISIRFIIKYILIDYQIYHEVHFYHLFYS
jgi:hypothetical protein